MPTLRIVSKKPKFNRIFRLTIGTGQNQVVIEDMGDNPYAKRISFNVTSALQSYTQAAVIQIYNLSDSDVNRITEIKSSVVLQAGYKEVHGDNPPVIYNGNIEYPNLKRIGTDIVTTLTCNAYRDTISSPLALSFEEGTSVASVLQAVQGDLTDPDGNPLPIEIVGSSELGNLTDDLNSGNQNKQQFLDQLSINYRFNWWCDTITKQIIVVPTGKALRENEIILVNAGTGLIGSPEMTANGLSFETLLEPTLRYRSLVQVEYSYFTAPFIIGTDAAALRSVKSAIITPINVSHMGDSRGNDWKTICRGNWYSPGIPAINEY